MTGRGLPRPPAGLEQSIDRLLPVAEALFAEIGRQTTRDGAICREPFGAGEQIAADLVAEAARGIGLAASADLGGNVHLRWNAVPDEPSQCLTGSHLDSVPRGGNFDGLAGVLAGMIAIAALRDAGLNPARNLGIVAMRGEENAWFGCNHIGSRVALGIFDPKLLDNAKRYDTGLSLGHYMTNAGIDLRPIRERQASIRPASTRCFVELHIEQGPILEARALATGVVTGIRGNVRHRQCRCTGAYGHAGVVPRELRQDAVMAVAELIAEMDRFWAAQEAAGEDLVMNFGRVTTDPAAHSITVIPGDVDFAFEARSHSGVILGQVEKHLHVAAAAIAERRRVTFTFDAPLVADPVPMNAALRRSMMTMAAELSIPTMEIASGAGHDAADFAEAGIPTGMVFVRNANGSHNPAEAMSISDFRQGALLMAAVLASEASAN